MSALISTPKDLEKVLKILKAEGVLSMRSGDVEIHLAPTFPPLPGQAPASLPKPPRTGRLTKEQERKLQDAHLFNNPPPTFEEGA